MTDPGAAAAWSLRGPADDPYTSLPGGEPVITIVGSINMDLVVTAVTLPQPGQTLLGKDFRTICGGKGANQAIAAGRAGGTVRIIGAIGDDPFGPELLANLAAAGVRIDAVRKTTGPSGIAVITVDEAAENSIVVVPGANGRVLDLTAAEQELIGESTMVVCQLEIPPATVVQAAEITAAAGHSFLLNPSPLAPLPAGLLSNTDVLVLNEGEAAAIGAGAVGRVPHVITTLGAAGARYRGSDGTELTVPAPVVDAVDTTGAGDAFTGAFAVARVDGLPMLQALQFACAAGALAASVVGASSSAPERAAIEQLVRRTY